VSSAHKQWQSLSEVGDLIEPKAKSREEFIKECQDGGLDGVVAAYRTFISVSITGFFDEELCNVLPKSWKYLGSCGESQIFSRLI
jgi:glyoxylate reductase